MKEIFISAQIDAPGPPDWLDQRILSKISSLGDDTVDALLKENKLRLPSYMDKRGKDYTERVLHHPLGDSVTAFTNTMFFEDDMTQWAQKNVIANAKDMRYTFTTPGRPRLGPHIDQTRNYTLLYIVKTGGDGAKTVFYKEKNHDSLIRENGYHVNDYNQLEEIISLVIPVGKWTLINARVLHSVENIVEGRRSFQIALDEMPPIETLRYPIFLHA